MQGRAVYQIGNGWVDSKLQSVRNQNLRRVQFASREWFEMLYHEPESAQFLALGRNVRFVMRDEVVEVYE